MGVAQPARRQTATSMLPQMATSTKTAGAAGNRLRVRNPPKITRARVRLLRLAAMEARRRAADPRHLAAVVAAGNPGQRALVAPQAAAAVAGGAGEPTELPDGYFCSRALSICIGESDVPKNSHNSFRLTTSAISHCARCLQQVG